MMGPDRFSCKVCDAATLTEVVEYRRLPRVTSDWKTFPAGGRLAVCETCGAVQKYPDQTWLAEIATIYGSYDFYPQSDDVDQVVRDPKTGDLRPRGAVLCDRLAELPDWRDQGAWLDFGCGAGAMLAAVATRYPGWALYGHDLDRRHLGRLTPLPGFRALYNGRVAEIPDRYDVVSLIHCIEHLVTPRDTVAGLTAKLAPQGRLFIQTADAPASPFDLVVADHLMHFSAETLAALIRRAGYAVEQVSQSWVSKELSLLARPAGGQRAAVGGSPSDALAAVRRQIVWLNEVVAAAQALAAKGPIGLFGSSIAATWLSGSLGDRVVFYVDEDPKRVGRTHLGRPIYRPAQVPQGATVFIGLVPTIAELIYQRLAGGRGTYQRPPPLPV